MTKKEKLRMERVLECLKAMRENNLALADEPTCDDEIRNDCISGAVCYDEAIWLLTDDKYLLEIEKLFAWRMKK